MLLSVGKSMAMFPTHIKALHGLSFRIDEGKIVFASLRQRSGEEHLPCERISRLVPVEAGTKMTFMAEPAQISLPNKVVQRARIPSSPKEDVCLTIPTSWRTSG